MKSKFLAVCTTAALAAGLALVGMAAPATATTTTPPQGECVASDAVAAYDETIKAVYETVIVTPASDTVVVDEAAGWQRYSWTGGPHTSDSAPAFPSADWQANTKSDPHNVGVAGAYYRSNGNSGNGDWFYLEATPEKSHTVHTDAVTENKLVTPESVVHHDAIPAVVCEEEPAFEAYEVCANWTVDNFPTNTADWSQTRLNTECTEPPAQCVPIRIQHDVYWIRDAEDKAYFEGLTKLNSPADDAQLEPHDYYVKTIAAKDCTEVPPAIQPTCIAVTGHKTIEGDGVISVPGEWESKSIALPVTGKLADIGTVLDIDATPLQYVGLHIHTSAGTIVFEEEASYNGQLWSTSTFEGVNPGLGYAALGTIEEFIAKNGNLAVTGIDLLYTSPEASSTTVTSATVACTVFTFVPAIVPPTEEPPVVVPPVVTPPTTTPPTPEVQAPVVAAAVLPATLPSTGADYSGLAAIAIILLFAAGIVWVIVRIRRNNSNIS